jgi:hypothetical protein
MAESIAQLARLLSLSDKALDAKRREFRMKHGQDAETELMKWLQWLWEESRDVVKVPGKTNGYVETVFGRAVPFHGALIAGMTEDGHEPESVRDDVQTGFNLDARTRRAEEAERSQEQARAQLRSVNEALRERIRRGEDIGPHLARLQRELRTDRAA